MQHTTFESVTKDQIADWKAKHDVYVVEVALTEDELDGPKAKFYMRPMSVAQQSALGEFAKKKNIEAREIQKTLLKTVVLAGDMEYLDFESEDSRVINALTAQYQEIAEKKRATLKKI